MGRGPYSQRGLPKTSQLVRWPEPLCLVEQHLREPMSSKVKGVPYLNPDPYCQFIGPKNLGEASIDGELATHLLDNGAQLNFISAWLTPAYAHKWGMDIMGLNSISSPLPMPISGEWILCL